MGFDLSEEFGSNETAEVEGVWVPLGEGARVRVSRLGNPKAQVAYKRIPRAVRRMLDEGTMTNTQATDFLARFISEHILKDWEGLADKGKTLVYSTETALEMLRTHRRFRDKIWELSCDEELFNVELEEDVKNLPKRSSGT